MGGANLLQKLLRRRLVRVAPTGDHDRVGAIEQLDGMRRSDRDAARRTQRPALGRAHCEVVPAHIELRSRQREQLDDAAELEGAKAIVGERNDEMGTRHGVILP